MPKIDEEYNNPFDKDAARDKYIPVKVNDHDLYDLRFNAARVGMQQSTFVRHRLGLNEVKRGAKKENQNALRKKVS